MAQKTVHTIKYKPVNPLPSELEVLFYEGLKEGRYTFNEALKILHTDKQYFKYYLNAPESLRLEQLNSLSFMLDKPLIEICSLALTRCIDFDRLRTYALNLAFVGRGLNLPHVRKVKARSINRKVHNKINALRSSLG